MKKAIYSIIILFIGLMIGTKSVYADSDNSTQYVNENLDYSFTTTDGTTESTTANGRPKVLIFYMPSCAPCHMLFSDIAKDPTHYTDYDILAIDITGSSLDKIKEYKESFGDIPVTFCYDENSVGFIYKKRLDNTYTIGTPYMVYIDSSNTIKRSNSGYIKEYYKYIYFYLYGWFPDVKSGEDKEESGAVKKQDEEETNESTDNPVCSLDQLEISTTRIRNYIKIKIQNNNCFKGYTYEISNNKTFKNKGKKITYKKVKKSTSCSIKTKKIAKSKKIYVRIRGYNIINGRKRYGNYYVTTI